MMPNAASKLSCAGQVKIINPGDHSIMIYHVCGLFFPVWQGWRTGWRIGDFPNGTRRFGCLFSGLEVNKT
jgi:hypothetical protein